MARGDHIYVWRTGYTHHGIDFGDGTVIHFTGDVKNKANAAIEHTPIDKFSKDPSLRIRVKRYEHCNLPETVIERALGRVGEKGYGLVLNNCEHFATWCKTGKHVSKQVKGFLDKVLRGVAEGFRDGLRGR